MPRMSRVGRLDVFDTRTISLSSAEITGTGAQQLNHANGKTIVAPVTGKRIVILQWTIEYTFGVAAYTGGSNIEPMYVEAGASSGAVQMTAANTLGAANSRVQAAPGLIAASTVWSGSFAANTVAIHTVGAAFTNPGTATGTARVNIAYALVDF